MKAKIRLKKILSLVLALSMVFALASCGSSSDESSEEEEEETTEAEEDTEEEETEEEEVEETEETDTEEDVEATETSSDEPVYGGDIVILESSDIKAYYDPSGMSDSTNFALWLEGLWAFDVSSGESAYTETLSTSSLKGQLAESWEWDEDTATLTVTLRDDVYFQTLEDEYDYYGGRQLVADDVKWSYDRLTGQGEFEEVGPLETDNGWDNNLSMLESVTVIDDLTVAFTLTSGDEITLDNFMNQFVKIGGHEWDDLTDEQQSDYHYACGTGPYCLEELEADVQVVLVRNENYYDTDPNYPENQLPYLDSITFVKITDSTNVVTQFIAGDLDIIPQSTLSDSQVQMIEDSDADYYTTTIGSSMPVFLALRCNNEYFDDVNVRIAMQLAIDMQTIYNEYLGEEGDVQLSALWNPITTEWSTVDTWDEELLSEYDYDPERAIELLEEAGYADGFETTIAIYSETDSDLFLLAADYWAEIGVTVNLEVYQTMNEISTIGSDETREESIGTSGCGACSSVTAAINRTIDGGWASYFWHGNEEFTELMYDMQDATSVEEQTELAYETDMIYAEEHWTVNLTGMQNSTDFFASDINFYEYGSVSSGKTAGAIFSTMYLSE